MRGLPRRRPKSSASVHVIMKQSRASRESRPMLWLFGNSGLMVRMRPT